MKIFLSMVLALVFGLVSTADAARLPFIEDLVGSKGGEEVVTHPEPAGLQPNWWRYFAVGGAELERRIQETLERLEGLEVELPPPTATAAHPYVELIKSNLRSLPQARGQRSPEPTKIPFAERYKLKQLLGIAERLRRTEADLQAEREDVTNADRAVKAAHRRIDTLMAIYLNLAPSDPARVLRGLEIMAERSSLALAEEQLRIRKAALLVTESRAEQLASELDAAAERLDIAPDEAERLDAQIEEAKKALMQAQEQAVNEQARALSVVSDDPEERATSHYRQQRALRASVQEAIAQVRLIRLQAERHLVELVLETKEIDTRELRDRLAEWNSRLAVVHQQAVTWASASRRERERASELVAGADNPDAPSTLTFIKLIHQDRMNLAQDTLLELQRLEGELGQAELIIRLLNQQLLAREGRIRDWLNRAGQILQQVQNQVRDWGTSSLFTIGGAPVTALGLLRVVLILFIFWVLSYWLRRMLKRFRERREGTDESAYYTLDRLSHYSLIAIGIMVGLASIGLDFTNFAVVAGLIGIGLGFGLQSIFNNFISGLILMFERTLKVGDFVELASGVTGEVRAINVRSTVIKTNENIDIVVPNSEFITGKVINWTLEEGYCRIHIPFKVAYGSDKELVRKAGLEAAEKVPHTLFGIPGRNPMVWLVSFGESSLNFELVVWVTPRAVKRPAAVNAAYMWEIDSALRRHGIEIPFPQRDLRLRSGFERLLQPAAEPPQEEQRPIRLYKEPL